MQPWGQSWLPRLVNMGRGLTPQARPPCSMLPKFVRGPLGPSLSHIDGQHGLDCRKLVAGEVSEQLLGATASGQDLEADPGLLLGAQGRYPDGKGHRSVLM